MAKPLTNQEIEEKLNQASDLIFDVGIELERRGWGRYIHSDEARLAGRIEDHRDFLKLLFAREEAETAGKEVE